MGTVDQLERTIDEYQGILADVKKNQEEKQDWNWNLIRRELIVSSGWTIEGAEEVTRLVRDYGCFVLRNALAVASVLDIEDGDLGY